MVETYECFVSPTLGGCYGCWSFGFRQSDKSSFKHVAPRSDSPDTNADGFEATPKAKDMNVEHVPTWLLIWPARVEEIVATDDGAGRSKKGCDQRRLDWRQRDPKLAIAK